MQTASQLQTFKRTSKICANLHDRVLFTAEQCPVCAALEELEAARIDIGHLEIQIYDLERKVEEL
jgi:hypothetical protein